MKGQGFDCSGREYLTPLFPRLPKRILRICFLFVSSVFSSTDQSAITGVSVPICGKSFHIIQKSKVESNP